MANKKGILENTVGKVTEGILKGADNLFNVVFNKIETKRKALVKKMADPKPKKATTTKTVAKKKK